MHFITTLLAVGFGGAIGAILRVIMGRLLPSVIFVHFPISILVINVLGCLAMGLVTELMEFYGDISSHTKSFITTGILGGFTTFSAFSLEYGLLHEKGLPWVAISYAAITFTLTISAFFIGIKLARTAVMHL